MGNLSNNISQNIQEFANNLIEEERSKSNSLNQSREYEEDKFEGGQTYINGRIMNQNAFYPNFTQKSIRVLVDSGIQLDVDIMSDSLTCGWLISEVTRLYTDLLIENNRLASKFEKQEKDFHHLVQQSRRQQLNFNSGTKPFGLKKEKKKLIVALKTYENNENLDHWLTMYDKQLHPIQDGEVLVAYFAKICPNKKKQISVEDFELLKVIGRGGFSRVILCRKKDTGRLYAMKILKKSKLIREKKIKPILSERSILERLDHPFIVKLHWAFQSKEELFFVMDICTGGEIFFHLNNFKKFPEALAKFYFTEILLGLEYLHKQDIVYRDIKPENILVDIDGHIKIADFGLAKHIPHRSKSYSFCGSPEYMSPEMLNGRGHDKQLDYYCLGALLYEMMTGLPPYYSKDTNEMYKRIIHDDLSFPDYLQSNHLLVDLITKLLAKDPKIRVQTVEEIKYHPWLKDTPYKKFLNKEIMPPFVPSMRETNFDPEFNDLPIDFDELQIKLRISTERRQSYYYESTVQSKACTENSFYFHNPTPVMNAPAELVENNLGILLNTNQTLFNNFFSNPGDDIKDIYNDSSGTNNTSNANNSIPNIKQQKPSSTNVQQSSNLNGNSTNLGNSLNNQSQSSQNQDNSDVFRNFSFYDSPLEENEILSQIKRCCIKIGQLPQHLYSTNPLNNQAQNKQQHNQNLEKLQNHMSQWMSSSRRLICEELEEEDEASNPKSSQDQEGEDGQLNALPSDFSATSIIIEHGDIQLEQTSKSKNYNPSHYDYKDSSTTFKNKETTDETRKQIDTMQQFYVNPNDHNFRIGEDFANTVVSFSSKSVNTYDESNQSVAQELRTNESIALNNYAIANMKYNGSVNPNEKLMNSDELYAHDSGAMIPMIKNHQYKKSMINPSLLKPSLEIQLPDIDHALLNKQLKQDSSTFKSSPFLPQKSPLSKKVEKNLKHDGSKDLLTLSVQKTSPKNQDKKQKANDQFLISANECLVVDKKVQQLAVQSSQTSKPQNSTQVQQPKGSFINSKIVNTSDGQVFKFNQFPSMQQKLQDINAAQSPITSLQPSNNHNGSSPEFKIHSRLQEEMLFKKQSFINETPSIQTKINIPSQQLYQQSKMSQEERSPDLTKMNLSKRQAAKFRSMDFSSNLNRATSLKNEERLIVEPRNIEEMQKQEILSDLQEASREGNSISMSPQRSGIGMTDKKPTPGSRIQTLKNSKAQPQSKAAKTTNKNKLESDQVSVQTSKQSVLQSKRDIDLKKKPKPNNIKLEQQMTPSLVGSKKSPTQQQQQQKLQAQQQMINQQQPSQQTPVQQPPSDSQQQPQGKTPHSSKNANMKPNLFSEKSQSNLQTNLQTNTPTQGGQVNIPSTIKGKIDFFNKDYSSIGVINSTSNQPLSATNIAQSSSKLTANKVQSSIKKKLQQQMEGAISRNDNNPKITGSSGVQTGTGGSVGSKKGQTALIIQKKKI